MKVVPTPIWLFMKAARMSGYPIDVFSGIRYYIDDHKRGAFELGASTTDVFDVTGRPAEGATVRDRLEGVAAGARHR